MALDSVHPDFARLYPEWTKMRDLYKGETAVKSKTTEYLPPTQSMILDGMGYNAKNQPNLGQSAYNAYLTRAVFHDLVKDAVETFVGMMHNKPATIELPAAMEMLRENATMYGESLEQLLRRINEEQLVQGRVGLLLDMPPPDQVDPANPMPYIAIYNAEAIRNWDDGTARDGRAELNLVILDESGMRRDTNFEWVEHTKYRVLQLGPLNEEEVNDEDGDGLDDRPARVYYCGVFEDAGASTPDYNAELMGTPMLRGKVMEYIPFTFVNTKDIIAAPDMPPLLGLGQLALAIYRGEADYRQNLFMQGQDTLVVIGGNPGSMDASTGASDGDAVTRVGAGAAIHVDIGGDAKYIGVGGDGLSEQRQALENDLKRAETKSGKLIDTNSRAAESGKALNTRISAQTASLKQIALTGAAALENILRDCAVWLGLDPEEVKVIPNLEFADLTMTGEDLVKLMTAHRMGAPLSLRSIHEWCVARGLSTRTYEEEMEEIEEGGPPAVGNPNFRDLDGVDDDQGGDE